MLDSTTPIRITFRLRALALAMWALACACTPSKGATEPEVRAAPGAGAVSTAPGPIPVGPDDPARGAANAPVTVVVFGDYSCPHCGRASALLRELEREYAGKLRVVWKHYPPDDDDSRIGAELGAGIHRLAGADAYWAYHDVVYGERAEGETTRTRVVLAIAQVTSELPLKTQDIARASKESGAAKVEADRQLGVSLGVRVVPTLFFNGIQVEGAGDKAELIRVIDAELARADGAIDGGVAAEAVYDHRVRANRAAARDGERTALPQTTALRAVEEEEEESDVDTSTEPFDPVVYKIPVGSSPVRGPATAPVTIVSFSDFECKFCVKGARTMRKLERRYGDRVRFVFKHLPLPFHKQAEPAAQLALEIHARKGDAAFWRAHDALFERNTQISDGALRDIATDAGLDPVATMSAVASKLHATALEADASAAEDGDARGTPTFFINGKRLTGAKGLGRFVKLIDQELADAEARMAAGVRPDALYETIIAAGKVASMPARVDVPAPASTAPARGPKKAPVLVHVFSDFQCPYCKEHAKRLEQLEQALPGKLRIVFHNNPLPSHSDARPAAILALEAKRQLGDTGFWQMHDLLFFDAADGLDRAGLEAKALTAKLDLAQVSKALDGSRFDKQLEADARLAVALEATATPITFINGYVVRGAQPVARMKRIVQLALTEAEAKARKTSSR